MIFCSLLNPALDCIYSIEQLVTGSTYPDTQFHSVPAGKGINVARVIATLGEQVCVSGIMPENDLVRSSKFLESLGIGHQFLTVPGSMRINTTILEKNSGNVTHINSCSSLVNEQVQLSFKELLVSRIRNGDLCCFSGSLPNGISSDFYDSLIRESCASGCTTLLDTRDDALRFGIRAKPDMIKPNIDELENYFGEQISGVHHIALKGKRLLDMGISYVFISLGSDGMIALNGNECLLCSTPAIVAKDTVGCGDALVAGLLVARKRRFSFSEMCRMAIACGTSKALHEGPGIVCGEEIWQLMEDVEITAV